MGSEYSVLKYKTFARTGGLAACKTHQINHMLANIGKGVRSLCQEYSKHSRLNTSPSD